LDCRVGDTQDLKQIDLQKRPKNNYQKCKRLISSTFG
jgi:hypothetical protein